MNNSLTPSNVSNSAQAKPLSPPNSKQTSTSASSRLNAGPLDDESSAHEIQLPKPRLYTDPVGELGGSRVDSSTSHKLASFDASHTSSEDKQSGGAEIAMASRLGSSSAQSDGRSNSSNLSDVDGVSTAHPPGVFPEMDELADQIGEFIHYWGFKRIHGRIWTHLFLAKLPIDAGELVTQLQISKALVSISLRELLDFGVIQEVGKSPRGTNLYRTNADMVTVITSVLRQREKRLLSRISAAQESLSRTQLKHREEAGLSDEKLDQLKLLVERASEGLDSIIAFKKFDFEMIAALLSPNHST